MIWLKAHNIARYYLDITSEFAKEKDKYKDIAKRWIVIPENMWKRLCLDEVDLWGQYYTILSNVDKPNGIIAILPWTKADPFIERIIKEICKKLLDQVKETSSDMSRSMEKILEVLFPKADKITDRFHFMKEVLDDIQTVRKNLKIEFKRQDNEARIKEKEMKKLWEKWIYEPRRSCMWETYLEIIHCCMYQCNIRKKDRNTMQTCRYKIMQWLSEFNELVICIDLIQELFSTLDLAKDINRKNMTTKAIKKFWSEALTIRLWKAKKVQDKCSVISAIISTTETHFEGLTNYFISMHSTAYAEWLHSRIRELIQNVRWFKNKDYMIYRILKMFS